MDNKEQDKKQTLNDTANHILWIDGIKGISCIFIFLHHFFLGVFPASYYGAAEESKLFGIDTFLSSSPLGLFLNGNFFVFLYLFISGYVITYQVFRIKPENLGVFHLKRYLKLSFPLAVFCVIFYILIKLDLCDSSSASLFMTVKQPLYKILYFGDTSYGGHFWMMPHIFLGGIFVSIIAATSHALKIKKIFLISLFFTAILSISMTWHYLTIFLACSYCIFEKLQLNTLHETEARHSKLTKLIFLIFLLLSIFLGAYPSGYMPENFYKYITLPLKPERSYHFYHMTAAFLLFVSVKKLNVLQSFFESKPCMFLAKISYAFFIFHGATQPATHPIFEMILSSTNNYVLSATVYLCISLAATVFISFILTKYAFIPFGTFVNKKINSWRK